MLDESPHHVDVFAITHSLVETPNSLEHVGPHDQHCRRHIGGAGAGEHQGCITSHIERRIVGLVRRNPVGARFSRYPWRHNRHCWVDKVGKQSLYRGSTRHDVCVDKHDHLRSKSYVPWGGNFWLEHVSPACVAGCRRPSVDVVMD